MIELKVTNGQNPVKAVKLCLPEEQAYLREKLKKIGVEENKYEITVVRCYPGNLERFIKKHTSLQMLNQLALRLKRLPVAMLYEVEAFLESVQGKSCAELFCLLDSWEKPERLEEAALYLPVSMQMVRCELMGEEKSCQKRVLSVQEAAEYLESWNEQIRLQRLDEEGLRGLAYYLNDQDIKKQVFSMDAELTMRQGTLYLKFSCHLKHALTDMEAEALRADCLRLCKKSRMLPFFSAAHMEPRQRINLAVSAAGSQFICQKPSEKSGKPAYTQTEGVLLVDVAPKKDGEDRDVLFMLPASPWGIRDLMEKMGVKEEDGLFICFVDCPNLPVFTDWLWSQSEEGGFSGTLSQWNTLSLLLKELDPFAQKRLEELAEALGEIQAKSFETLHELILWAKDGILLEGITDDTALGQYCLENGYFKDQAWLLEQYQGYLDYEKIGMEWRESDGGIYTKSGYLIEGMKMEAAVFPNWPSLKEDASIRICLKKSHGEEIQVYFPEKQDGITEAWWQRMLSEAELVEIDCLVPALIPSIYEALEQLERIQTLSKRLKELENGGQLVKFQALLELWDVTDLESAIQGSFRLEEYQYYGACRSAHSLGWMLFQVQCNVELTEEEKETIDFSRYGKRMAARCGAVETSYGYLLPKGE